MQIYAQLTHTLFLCSMKISLIYMFQFCLPVVVYNQLNILFFVFALRPPPPPPLFRLSETRSESSDLSDSLEELARSKSPEMALEAISGVQPELQSTLRDSEIYSKFCFMFF